VRGAGRQYPVARPELPPFAERRTTPSRYLADAHHPSPLYRRGCGLFSPPQPPQPRTQPGRVSRPCLRRRRPDPPHLATAPLRAPLPATPGKPRKHPASRVTGTEPILLPSRPAGGTARHRRVITRYRVDRVSASLSDLRLCNRRVQQFTSTASSRGPRYRAERQTPGAADDRVQWTSGSGTVRKVRGCRPAAHWRCPGNAQYAPESPAEAVISRMLTPMGRDGCDVGDGASACSREAALPGCCHGTLPLIRANASPESADPACQRTLRPD